jgi:hypothetical protein
MYKKMIDRIRICLQEYLEKKISRKAALLAGDLGVDFSKILEKNGTKSDYSLTSISF